jgi:RNA polymerase sigma factor (sigma-70 family)
MFEVRQLWQREVRVRYESVSNEAICAQFKRLDSIDGDDPDKIREEVYTYVVKSSTFLLRKIISKYRGLDNYDDLYQIGQLVLFKAVKSFSYTESPNFYAWCYRWIRKEVAVAAFKHRTHINKFKPIDTEKVLINRLVDIDLDDVVFSHERRDIVLGALNDLSSRSEYIIKKVFGLGEQESSLRAIGHDIGISHEHVRRLRDDAIQQLRFNQKLNTANG